MTQIDLWQKNLGLFNPTCQHKVVGTPFHDSDLYGHMRKAGNKKLDMNILSCRDENRQSQFPELMTTERLDEMESDIEMGLSNFAAIMMCNPLPAESPDRIKESDLMFYEPGHIPDLTGMVIGVVLDPGWSTTRFAHGHGIIACAKDWTDNLYVLGQYTDKQEGEATIEKTIRIAIQWHAQVIVVEATVAQKLFQERLQRIVAERQLHIQVVGVTTGRQDKLTRIRTILIPPIQAHQIWLMRGMNELLEQLLRLGVAEKMDLVDALAHAYAGLPRPHRLRLTSMDESETMDERDPSAYISVPALMRKVQERRRQIDQAAAGW